MSGILNFNQAKFISFSCFAIIILTGCNQPKKVIKSNLAENTVLVDTVPKNFQDSLAQWLIAQPQEVRDAFKRDFTFSKKQIESLKDTLRDTTN